MTRRLVEVRLVCLLILGACQAACWPDGMAPPGVRMATGADTVQGTETHWGTKGTETHWGTKGSEKP